MNSYLRLSKESFANTAEDFLLINLLVKYSKYLYTRELQIVNYIEL